MIVATAVPNVAASVVIMYKSRLNLGEFGFSRIGQTWRLGMLKKLSTVKRMMATEGAVATMRFVNDRLSRRLFGTPQTWRKYDLINELARIHGYRSFLEISTSRSGYSYCDRDQSRFDVCRRLSYLTPDDWTDGEPVDYRCSDHDSSECLRQIQVQGLSFDIVFVDGCHEYECSRRDIEAALNLVNDNGVIVLHDCLPHNKANCPPFRGDMASWWLGVTYKAYIDALIARNNLWYCTVDTDVGCGMIRSIQKTRRYKRIVEADEVCIHAWRSAGDNYDAVYQIYERNRNGLMNVVTVGNFLRAERQSRTNTAAR